jgi:hypothetical protein
LESFYSYRTYLKGLISDVTGGKEEFTLEEAKTLMRDVGLGEFPDCQCNFGEVLKINDIIKIFTNLLNEGKTYNENLLIKKSPEVKAEEKAIQQW